MPRIRMHKTVVLTFVSTVTVLLLLLTLNFRRPQVQTINVFRSGYDDQTLLRARASDKLNQEQTKSQDALEGLSDVISSVSGTSPPGYFEFEQYKRARLRLNLDSNQYVNLRSHKMNANSSYSNNPQRLQFSTVLNLSMLPKIVDLSVQVKDTQENGRPVPGCSFRTKIYFGDNFRQMALCATSSYDRPRYSINCPNYGSMCFRLEAWFRFANYEQYQDEPRILPADILIYNKTHCLDPNAVESAKRHVNRLPFSSFSSPFSWRLHPNNDDMNDRSCGNLLVNNHPVTQATAKETCGCVGRFDDVYLIGTSHLRFFGDYLLKQCHAQNFTGIAHNHKDLEAGNVHYLAWVFIEQLHFEIQVNLQKWLDPDLFAGSDTPKKPLSAPPRRIAIWIQTGSWDFSKVSYNFTMERALPQFEETLHYIQTTIAKSPGRTRVDLRVISTTPMTDAWYMNNYAIGAFNARQRDIVTGLGVDFTDMFEAELPCKDDLEGNHYFYRVNETFGGKVGGDVYFGHFLPKVCNH